jgi:homoserine dehydrogenase
MNDKFVKVGIIGLGTVGSGVAEILLKEKQLLKNRTSAQIELKTVVDVNWSKSLDLDLSEVIKSSKAEDILNDPEIDVVVETVGGIEPAKTFISKALKNGKHVVTANKALIATHGRDLFQLAFDNKVYLMFEASVGGGIPIIKALREGLVANNIHSIFGILNGTSNYILTKMHTANVSFAEALKEAQELGFAEADPTLDVEGGDAAHKIAILASLASSAIVNYNSIHVEGITKISPLDIGFAKQFEYTIKLLAVCRLLKDGLDVRVHPTLVPNVHSLASVRNEFNAIFVQSDYVGNTMFYGPGAGQKPTASAIIADICDIVIHTLGKEDKSFYKTSIDPGKIAKVIPLEEIANRFYLRMYTYDAPGILAQISKILGEKNVSIASVLQLETHEQDNYVPIVILTHEAMEKDMHNAITRINDLPFIRENVLCMRLFA